MYFREDSLSILDSIGIKQIVKNLWASQKYHNMKLFLAFICNQKNHYEIKRDWFQTTLNTRVLVNVTKFIKKSPILRCVFLQNVLVFFLTVSSLHLAPIQKCSGQFYFILFPMLTGKRAPLFCHFFV